MRFTIVISVLFHVAVLALGYLVLPDFKRAFVAEPLVPVEILREADLAKLTSVPETSTEPLAEEPPEIETLPEPVAPPEPEIVPQVAEDLVPALPQEEPQEPEEPVVSPKPEPVKPTPPKPKEEELDLAFLEDSLKDLVPDKDVAAPREAPVLGERDQERVGLGEQLTASEESRVKAALAGCWNFDAGVPDAETLIVKVEFYLNRDGSLKGEPKVLNSTQIRRSGNPFWLVAERAAVNAVLKCAPYDFLPPERYDVWREFALRFDPGEMAGF